MKMMRFLFVLYFTQAFNTCWSQVGWLAQQKGAKSVRVSQLKADKNGNALVISGIDQKEGGVIQTNGPSIIVEGNDTLLGYPNMHISQYNKQGGINWHLTIKSKNAVYANCLEIDSENNYYIGGNYKHDALFSSTKGKGKYIPFDMMESYKYSLHRFFIAKYSYEGELLWVKTGLSWDNAFCKKIICDNKGNAYTWVYTPTHTLVFDDILFEQKRNEYFVNRHLLVLAKINSTGEIEWITRSGDELGAGDIWFTDKGNICVQAGVTRHWYFFLYLDGTRTEIKEMEKDANYKDHFVNEYILSSKTGKLIDRREVKKPNIKGNHGRAFASKVEDFRIVTPFYNVGGALNSFEIEGKKFSTHGRNENIKVLCKLKKNGEIDWYICIWSDGGSGFLDIEPMADGTYNVLIYVQGKSTITHSSGDSIEYPFYKNLNYDYLLKLDKDGRVLDRKRVGCQGRAYSSEGGRLSSPDGKALYLSNNITYSGKYLGQVLEPNQRDPNYPSSGGYMMGYVCLNPFSKDSIEMFETDSSEYTLFASTEIKDTNKNEIIYYSYADSSSTEKNDSVFSTKDTLALEIDPRIEILKGVSIYPNPVKSENPNFYISFNYSRNSQAIIEVLSKKGATVYKNAYDITIGQNVINLTPPRNLSPGVYLIRVNIDGQIVVKRLVIA
jgi:hypothetical protein